MNRKEQKIIDLTIKTLFEKYGELKQLETEAKTMVYAFFCDPKKIFKKNNFLYNIGTVKFLLLITSSSQCFIYAFRLGSSKGIKRNILPLINKLNSSLEYGKYILDSDDDIDWEFKININYTVEEDVYDILRVFIMSLLDLATNIDEIKKKRKR